MCFSATVSFSIAGLLLPAASYSICVAWLSDRRWLGMAVFPAAFGVQQAIEGAVWLGIAAGNSEIVELGGRGFVVFSHFFWLAWVPLSVRMIEPEGQRRRWLAILAAMGALGGLSIMLPNVMLDGWLQIGVMDGSINYETQLLDDGTVVHVLLRVAYGAIILGALFLSSWAAIRVFGGLILASALLSTVLFPDVFISVWCFFAAVLSAYLVGLFAWRARASRRGEL
jgi:hypothetical protein